MKTIVWKGVIRGAVLAGVIGATASILGRNLSTDSTSQLALTVILLVGLVLGGFAAGREAPRYAFTNGALASFLAFAVVELIGVVSQIARGQAYRLNPFGIVFLGVLSVSCGVVGGALASAAEQRRLDREARKPREPQEPREQEGSA
ncbi:MAG: YrzE family protein [Actinobacteria bacterium]|nr:YrzE family protein [Actinomycetota bacterium]